MKIYAYRNSKVNTYKFTHLNQSYLSDFLCEKTLENIYINKEDFYQKNNYIKKVSEEFKGKLSKYILDKNQFKDALFWETVLIDWLIQFITKSYDTYLNLKKNVDVCDELIFDYLDFAPQIESKWSDEEWNQYLTHDLASSLKIKTINLKNRLKNNQEKEPKILNKIHRTFINTLLGFTNSYKKNSGRILNIDLYGFNMLDRLAIIFDPRFININQDFLYINNQNSVLERFHSDLIKDFQGDEFSSWVNKSIIKYIPAAFLENHSIYIKKFTKYFNNNNKIKFLTSHYLDSNNNYYYLIAMSREKKIKHIRYQHGSFYLLTKTNLAHYCEYLLSDFFITWGDYRPKGNFLSGSRTAKTLQHKKKKLITIISYGIFRHRLPFYGWHVSINPLKYIEWQSNIINVLRNNFKQTIVLKTRNYNFGDKEYFSNKYHDLIIEDKMPFGKLMQDSRFVVCTYLSTAFFESLFNQIPVFLVICSEIHDDFSLEFQTILDRMQKVGIYHNNIEEFDEFICYTNSLCIEKWWLSKEIQSIRDILLNKYFSINNFTANNIINNTVDKIK